MFVIEDIFLSDKDAIKYLHSGLKYVRENGSHDDIARFESDLYKLFEVPDDAYCIVTQTNHIFEVQYIPKKNSHARILKLDSDTYVNLSTGEIKEFKKQKNRSDSVNSLRQTFKKMRYLINNNFVGAPNELFVTLTYKKNMTNSFILYDDFRKFIKKLRYRFADVSKIDYFCVVEPQERGSWHCHVLLRFNGLKKAYIAKKELSDIWGHGFVFIENLQDVDNVGAYLSAYLTDLPVFDDDLDTDNKKFIKGARLHLYPPGMNLYRKSKGIVFPERKYMKLVDIKKYVGSGHLTYFNNAIIKNDDFETSVTSFYYNLKR